ncbi:MAG: sigma-70 family RNA polymerase sigma factor [Planctomycetales bacterium]|nr:sigma-70 family RNA polymerase sigma factor [Planctomycetales bacterium]
MSQSPPTRPSLLIRLRDSTDHDAWKQFVEIYTPLVYAYCRRRGLQDADASDLAQDVMQIISKRADAFDYDKSRGTFRGWLFTVTLNRLRDWAKKAERKEQGSGKSAVHQVLNEMPAKEAEDLWNKEHQWRLFQWAAERAKPSFRETSWNAFWLTAVEQKPAKEVAESLSISVGAVHIAKSRALAKIREIVDEVEN